VQLDVQETEHGPLLNPILPKEKRAIALKWTLYDPSLNTLPVYEIDKASNWGEFEGALKLWSWPAQNVVYADDQGHIAYHAIGKVPIHLGSRNIYPIPFNSWMKFDLDSVPGKENERIVYLPFDVLPHAFDPPSGFLATANSRVTRDVPPDSTKRYPLNIDMSTIPLTAEWADPYRAERIYKLLDGRNGLTRADYAGGADGYLQRSGSGDWTSAGVCDRPHGGRGRAAEEGSRPDAELGWAADDGLGSCVRSDQSARGVLAADSRAKAGQGTSSGVPVGGVGIRRRRDHHARRFGCSLRLAAAGI
jgi:hypothetical protein